MLYKHARACIKMRRLRRYIACVPIKQDLPLYGTCDERTSRVSALDSCHMGKHRYTRRGPQGGAGQDSEPHATRRQHGRATV